MYYHTHQMRGVIASAERVRMSLNALGRWHDSTLSKRPSKYSHPQWGRRACQLRQEVILLGTAVEILMWRGVRIAEM